MSTGEAIAFGVVLCIALPIILLFIWVFLYQAREFKRQNHEWQKEREKRNSEFQFWNKQCSRSMQMMADAKEKKDYYAYSRARQAHETNMKRLEQLIYK